MADRNHKPEHSWEKVTEPDDIYGSTQCGDGVWGGLGVSGGHGLINYVAKAK
jgi:hypothetical protein